MDAELASEFFEVHVCMLYSYLLWKLVCTHPYMYIILIEIMLPLHWYRYKCNTCGTCTWLQLRGSGNGYTLSTNFIIIHAWSRRLNTCITISWQFQSLSYKSLLVPRVVIPKSVHTHVHVHVFDWLHVHACACTLMCPHLRKPGGSSWLCSVNS